MPVAVRFWRKVRQCAHGDFCPFCCWEWTANCNKHGYGLFGIKEDTKWANRLAHTIAWKLVNACPIPDGLQINHHCDNPPCCNPWHIYAGTPKENALDAQRRGRLAVGEARSFLTEADVLLMRTLYRQGYALRDLTEKFHVTEATIFSMLTGQTWKHVPGALSVEERQAFGLAHRRTGWRSRKRTILTEDAVREIHMLAQKGMTHSALARQFGVTRTTIRAVVARRIWKDIL